MEPGFLYIDCTTSLQNVVICTRSFLSEMVVSSLVLVTLILAADWQYVTALPGGAPLAACEDMTQQHAGISPMPCGSDCPFQLTLIAVDGVPVAASDPLEYTCGAQHTCE